MHRPIRYLVAIALVVGACLVLPAAKPAQAEYVSTPIMGTQRLTGPQIANWYRAVSYWEYRGSVPLDTLAQYFVEEGARYGVRGDIAFAQSILETLWLNFPDYGQVHPSDNNYSGIGACNSCSNGYNFPTARLGVRAQIQHLRNYADPNSRAATLPDPPLLRGFDTFFLKGRAPTWEGLNGRWAVPGTTYAQNILSIYNRMLTWNGLAPITTTTTRPPTTTTTRPPTTTTTTVPLCPVAAPATPGTAGKGYWLASSDGTVTAFGSAANYGSLKGKPFKAPVRAITATPTGLGYWLLASDGTVFAFGDAKIYPRVGWVTMDRTIVGMASTPTGKGYWLAGADGTVFSFGDAKFYGHARGVPWILVFGISPSPTGKGYRLLLNGGGIANYGDAAYLGSASRSLAGRAPASLVTTRTGTGYWILAKDGRVFAFGDARKYGDFATCKTRSVLALGATGLSDGYWISTTDGRMTSFGAAKPYVQTQVVGSTPVAMAVIN